MGNFLFSLNIDYAPVVLLEISSVSRHKLHLSDSIFNGNKFCLLIVSRSGILSFENGSLYDFVIVNRVFCLSVAASKMRIVLVRFREVSQKYPIVRGMASYAVIWPTASLIQQKLIGKDELSYAQALRFSIYGGFFVAPTLYCWLKCASYFWPKSDLRSAITKALVEQVTYSPAAMCCFFFGINLLELKPVSDCIDQVKEKFWPTYKIGVCVWPVLQTINFFLVPEHNRVVYVSVCSLMWTSFLAYMKSIEAQRNEMQLQIGAVMQNTENVGSKTIKEPAAEASNKTKERVPVLR